MFEINRSDNRLASLFTTQKQLSQAMVSFVFLFIVFFLPSSTQANELTKTFDAARGFATLSLASYDDEATARKRVMAAGFQMVFYKTIPGIEVQVLVAADKQNKQQIIAVRGTSNIENMVVNSAFKLRPHPQLKIALHEGFSQAADAIWAQIKPILKPNYKTDTTGHSLGGGIALILAMHLDQAKFNLGSVVTFGQPKVTNIRGAMAYGHLNLTRFATPLDVVPLVPPLDIMDINKPDIYWHLGQEILLLDSQQVAFLKGIPSMMRATRIFDQQINEQNFAQHRMTHYQQHIINNSKQATIVEYDPAATLKSLIRHFL